MELTGNCLWMSGSDYSFLPRFEDVFYKRGTKNEDLFSEALISVALISDVFRHLSSVICRLSSGLYPSSSPL